MSFCRKCGSEIREGVKYCPVCGEEIRGIGTSENKKNKFPQIPSANIHEIGDKIKAVQDESAKKLEVISGSDAIQNVKTKTGEAGNWYVVNWKHVFDGNWSGDGLKHHLAWLGLHLGVILVMFLAIHAIGKPRVTIAEVAADDEGQDSWFASGTDESMDSGVSDRVEDEGGNLFDSLKESVDDVKADADYYKKVLFSSLDGTWTNSSGTFTLTIGKDGTVKIADSTGTFGADAFTYTEVDDDTVRLKVDTDNALVGMLSIDMDYEVSGETLSISALGQTFNLTRAKQNKSATSNAENSNSRGGFALGDIFGSN